MMPQLLSVRVRRPGRRPIWIPLPVLPTLLVLSPILLLAWRIVSALPGTRFGLEQGRSAVLVSVR